MWYMRHFRFHNLDKIIHYVNINASLGGPVTAFYSSPSHYTDSLKKVTVAKDLKWEVRSDDVFPLGDQPHAYWSGYFTSRPALKRQVRYATNFLAAARQMEVFAGVTAAEVNLSTTRPSPPVGTSWTDSLEGTIGVATHHDGMSGTERQSVSNDYAERISESHFEVEAGVAMSLQKLTGAATGYGHCNCNEAGNCLNLSVCAYTTGKNQFTVTAWCCVSFFIFLLRFAPPAVSPCPLPRTLPPSRTSARSVVRCSILGADPRVFGRFGASGTRTASLRTT